MRNGFGAALLCTLVACSGTISLGEQSVPVPEPNASSAGAGGVKHPPDSSPGGAGWQIAVGGGNSQGGADSGTNPWYDASAAGKGGSNLGGNAAPASWATAPDGVPYSMVDSGTAGATSPSFSLPLRAVAVSPDARIVAAGINALNYNIVDLPCGASQTKPDGLLLFFDTAGKAELCVSLASSGADAFTDVARSPTGDFTAVGTFQADAMVATKKLLNNGDTDLAVVQTTAKGEIRWVRAYGYEGDQEASAVAVDGAGNVFVAGTFEGTIISGGEVLNATGSRSALVFRLNKEGEWQWGRAWGSGWAGAVAVASTNEGRAAVLGRFDGPLDIETTHHQSQGGKDIFLALVESSGEVLWSKSFGNPGKQTPTRVVTDSQGGIVITGLSIGAVDFGGGLFQPEDGCFVASFAADGTLRWSTQLPIGEDELLMAIPALAVDGKDNVLFAIGFRGALSFGTALLKSVGSNDLLVLAWDSNGLPLWSHHYASQDYETSRAIAYSAQGGLALSGVFSTVLDLGTGSLKSYPGGASFVARFPPF